jgi:hypothetical protein
VATYVPARELTRTYERIMQDIFGNVPRLFAWHGTIWGFDCLLCLSKKLFAYQFLKLWRFIGLPTAACAAIAVFGLVPASLAVAQDDSTWIAIGDSGSWIDVVNWIGPVPTDAGDTARLRRSTPGTVTVDVASPMALGNLTLSQLSSFTVSGAGSMSFDNSGQASTVQVNDSLQQLQCD